MSILDLLIDLYNNEEMPKKIMVKGIIYLFDNDINWYIDITGDSFLESNHKHINDEVEIIEYKEKEENNMIKNLINLRKNLEQWKKDIEYTWKIDLQTKEMPPIYYMYEGKIDLIDDIIKDLKVGE